MSYNKDITSEDKYYGSDLNKFMANHCKKEMTVMNIDLITYDREKKHIRIIESKHLKERTGYGQGVLLRTLNFILKQITDYRVTVFIVRGNYPYDFAYIENVMDGKKKKLNKEQLINFLNYD